MKIKSLLIANRGEIAIRIIRTARKMGIRTYVIKTIKEPNAWYLEEADEIIDFSESFDDSLPEFLDIDRIIASAKKHKVDAIHPGYGFLAENPDFAKRCEEEKIVFIGPSHDAIYRMGHKTIAKELARKHNVPLLGGSPGAVANAEEARKIANEIGYPVILKAAAGGGGRGMRVVEKEKDIERMFTLATNEAEKAFNNPDVFLERFVREPRHIEFQILGDQHGNIVHLGERECSVQRKHQKLLEESPSPALDNKMRKKMGEAAINIAKAVNYYSAGTVEFLLDEDKSFTFMEMNTRIQVEHPVTEMVTGIDLIEQMILVAEGKKLAILTRNGEEIGKATLKAAGLDHYFAEGMLIGRETCAPKPQPDGVHHLLKLWGADKSNTVIVGDYLYDIQAGFDAGIRTIHFDSQGLFPWPEYTHHKITRLQEINSLY